MSIDEALESIDNFRAYMRALPQLDENDMYLVYVLCDGGESFSNHLVMATNDDEAIEEFDITFLEIHREELPSKPKHMTLLAPRVGDTRECIATISLEDK